MFLVKCPNCNRDTKKREKCLWCNHKLDNSINPDEEGNEIEKESVSIKGNETVEELVKKVNKDNPIGDRMGQYSMIMIHLEMKNNLNPGSSQVIIGGYKERGPTDPREDVKKLTDIEFTNKEQIIEEYYKTSDIKLFLFLLKKYDKECCEQLINVCSSVIEKKSNKHTSSESSGQGCLLFFILPPLLYILTLIS